MKNTYTKIKLNDAYFVSSEGELCYKEVLDTFESCEYIDILTYNISTSNNMLIEALKNAATRDIPIRLITNIPNRWPSYFYEGARRKASDTIKTYVRKLNPDTIGNMVSVSFKFNNHAKIILTDKMVYFGSANFSDESRKNYECGALSSDKEFITYVHNDLFPYIMSSSIDYYKRNYISYVASVYGAIAYLNTQFDEIHDASYGICTDYDTKWEDVEYYNYHHNYISWKMLTKLMETIRGFEEMLSSIISELEDEYEDFISDEDFEHYEEAEKLVSDFRKDIECINEKIQDVCYVLKEMTCFDEEDTTFDILNEEYGSVAYEESLEYYLDIASNDAREKKEELIREAKEYIDLLLQYLEEYEDILLSYVDKLHELCQENDEIDNT